MMSLKQQLPELNDNQLKLLYHVICDEIIGHDENEMRPNWGRDYYAGYRNHARTKQRQKLAKVLGLQGMELK